ncbi:MAG: GNAT family N-acetyltransferase [Gammaproteobacteria bacterium]|nr:GNAT family N-acetyltransferase [Gammaproteobacteria bacterium]
MPALRLLDLRDHTAPDLLAGFIDLYERTFSDPSEREDPAQWPLRLYGDLPAPQPRMHLLVAVDDAIPERPIGGIAFEYYRDSRCGLLTYLVTDPAHRRRGLARRLLDYAIARLHRDAQEYGTALRAVFAEAEDPDQVGAYDNTMPPRERLATLARLGARRIDIPYVQPRLEGGSEPCRHLLLLAFHPDTPDIAGTVVRDFLHEFYRALGIARPETDTDFVTMTCGLDKPLRLGAL